MEASFGDGEVQESGVGVVGAVREGRGRGAVGVGSGALLGREPEIERLLEGVRGEVTVSSTNECADRWAELGSELGLWVRLYGRLPVGDRMSEYADKEGDTNTGNQGFPGASGDVSMSRGGELEQLIRTLVADPEKPGLPGEDPPGEAAGRAEPCRTALRRGCRLPHAVQRCEDPGHERV